MIDFYGKQGKLHRIDANRKIEDITGEVEKHLDSLGIFPGV